jgi:predicted small lipoprotein YifL
MDARRGNYGIWLLAATLALGILLSACGQKGDLYLPDQKPPQQNSR